MILLYPIAILYDAITRLRNWLFDKGWKHSVKFDIPVISVGNLAVGGTGKTPHIEYIARLLQPKMPIAILSRGYGRKTKGYLLANAQSTANSIGDEPMQFFTKFGAEIPVAVGEKRALAIPKLLADRPQTKAILLDDAFQHRAVTPSMQILLTEWNKPFCQDWVLPAGRLRESRSGAKRAHAVIVTKCPETSAEQRQALSKKLRPYLNANTPIFFTKIGYAMRRQLSAVGSFGQDLLLVTGIVNPLPLAKYLRELGFRVRMKTFPDHHAYTAADIAQIGQERTANEWILLTEKDAVKWLELKHLWNYWPVYDQPISVQFIEEQEAFDALILRASSGALA